MVNKLKNLKVMIVVNDINFFFSHRLNIAKYAKLNEYEVTIACPWHRDVSLLAQHDLKFLRYDVQRGAKRFFWDLVSIIQLLAILLKNRPDVVHLVTAKPIIFGGFIARILQLPSIAAVSGLGAVYSNDRIFSKILRIFINTGYKLAIKHSRCVAIFQNEENLEYFDRHNMVGVKKVIIKGSGANLTIFNPKKLFNKGLPIILMPCRMLETKGVLVFLKAAKIVNADAKLANFVLAGSLDPENPSAVAKQTLQDASNDGIVEWVGYVQNIASIMAKSSMVVLPSFYNEGLPKTLIDAAAAGRAVITTDTAGCRDAIIPGVTGLLVRARDENDLAEKIRELLFDPDRCEAMGRAGRRLAEQEFCDIKIAKQHVDIYDKMIKYSRGVEPIKLE